MNMKLLTHPSSVVSSWSCIGGGSVSLDSQPVCLVFFLILDVATHSTFKVALAWEGACGENTHCQCLRWTRTLRSGVGFLWDHNVQRRGNNTVILF